MSQTNSAKKVLLLFAHPAQNNSEVNVPMFEIAKEVPNVTSVDLYELYPKYNINVEKEQERLLNHDVIIFQFPLYWYSTPAILKEWQDLVFEYGFAYGTNGTKLHNKLFLCAVSAGAKESAYCKEGKTHFSINDILTPFKAMTNLTGLEYLTPFVLFDARLAMEKGLLNDHIKQYKELLISLTENNMKKVHKILFSKQQNPKDIT